MRGRILRLAIKLLGLNLFLVSIQACSTVCVSRVDEQGRVDACFQPIKVLAKANSSYSYQFKLADLAKLYECPSSFEFTVLIKSKIPFFEQREGKRLTPLVKSLQREGGGKVQFLYEKCLSPTSLQVSFSIPLKDIEEAIAQESNFIFNVNKGEMYWLISCKQLKDLKKVLIKKGYLIDGF